MLCEDVTLGNCDARFSLFSDISEIKQLIEKIALLLNISKMHHPRVLLHDLRAICVFPFLCMFLVS